MRQNSTTTSDRDNPITTTLNARQERFVAEYLKDGNGTQAAIRTGYAESSAAVHAHRLLKNDKVLSLVRARQKRVSDRAQVSLRETLQAFTAIAFFDPGCMFDGKGNVLPLNKMPKEAHLAIDRLEVYESVVNGRRVRTLKSVRFVNKLTALQALGKHLGMFPKPRTVARRRGHGQDGM